MFEIQGTKRMFSLIGRRPDGSVGRVPDIVCVRKHLEPHHKEYRKLMEREHWGVFSFVSSPSMPQQQSSVLSRSVAWCHPFRNREQHLKRDDCGYLMMPESDFLDRSFVAVSDKMPKHDFFYMTQNDKTGKEYKGLEDFVSCLPILCGEFDLRGVVVVYFPTRGHIRKLTTLTKQQRKIIGRYQDHLRFVWGWQKQEDVAKIMASCRFGFFPNRVDCSPRMIPECLIRNRSIIVNKHIWGGWHYVNDRTGAFFDTEDIASLRDALSFVKKSEMKPAADFKERFGFARSSARLAEFLKGYFPAIADFTHVYFSPFEEAMRKIND